MRRTKILLLAGFCAAVLACLVTHSAAGAAACQKASPEAAKPEKSEAATKGDSAKGKELYRLHCEICHFSRSTEKKIGPGLKGLYPRGAYADGKKVDDKNLRAWIERGGKNMPAFQDQLKTKELEDLIAYVKTL